MINFYQFINYAIFNAKKVADLKKGEIYVKGTSNSPKPQCTVLITDDNFVSLASGTANPQTVNVL